MVEGAGLVLLVSPLVFFVNDNQAQVGHRREQGAARPDHHVVLTISNPPPAVELLGFRQPAVQHRHPAGETGIDTLHRLGSEGYFRHQEDALLPPGHHPPHRPQVHLGLAAARDSVEQEAAGLELRVVYCLGNAAQCIGLGRCEGQGRRGGCCRGGAVPVYGFPHPFLGQQSLFYQGIGYPGTIQLVGEAGGIAAAVGLHRSQQPLLPLRCCNERFSTLCPTRRVGCRQQVSLVPESPGSGQVHLAAYQPGVGHAVQLAGTVASQQLHELGLTEVGVGTQLLQCLPGPGAQGLQPGLIQGKGADAGAHLGFEPRGQQQLHGGEQGAAVVLAQPSCQLQSQGTEQRGGFHGLKDVPGDFHLGSIGQGHNQPLGDAAAQRDPY